MHQHQMVGMDHDDHTHHKGRTTRLQPCEHLLMGWNDDNDYGARGGINTLEAEGEADDHRTGQMMRQTGEAMTQGWE